MSTGKETKERVVAKKIRAPKAMLYRQAVITLVIGDFLCCLSFPALGSGSHGEVTGLAAIPHIILVALPFAIGWFLVSPFVGAFRRDVLARPRAMAIRTALAWLLSWPVTMVLPAFFFNHGIPPSTFPL